MPKQRRSRVRLGDSSSPAGDSVSRRNCASLGRVRERSLQNTSSSIWTTLGRSLGLGERRACSRLGERRTCINKEKGVWGGHPRGGPECVISDFKLESMVAHGGETIWYSPPSRGSGALCCDGIREDPPSGDSWKENILFAVE